MREKEERRRETENIEPLSCRNQAGHRRRMCFERLHIVNTCLAIRLAVADTYSPE